MSKILVVDDEPSMLAAFEELLGGLEHEVATVGRADAAIELLRDAAADLVILDIQLPGMSGLEALGHIKRQHPKLPVIMITGHGTMSTAIEATKLGAFDYQLKPIEPEAMLATIVRALEGVRLMRGEVALGAGKEVAAAEAIVGRCPAMQEVYKAIGRVARTDAAVLIRGESGTGKELVARAIYQYSLPRKTLWSSSIAPRFPRPCWRANSSATSAALSPALSANGSASSSKETKGPCSSTRLGTCPWESRPKSSASFRTRVSSALAATTRSAATSGYWPPPIGTSRRQFPRAALGRISSTA